MRIAVLTWVEEEGAEGDPVADQVTRALREAGHEVAIVAASDDVDALMRLRAEPRPEFVFNLTKRDVAVAGALELLGIPYTGGGPGELFLAQDKALGEKLFALEGLRYAELREGRELCVGVIGNAAAIALPPRANVPDALATKLQQVSIAACRALKVRDYARVDLLVNGRDEVLVLAVNANCDLEQHGELATAAKAAGIEYPELIDRLVRLALERHRAAHPRMPATLTLA